MNGTKRPLPEPEDDEEQKSKLTREQVTRLRQRYQAGGITIQQLANIYGISRSRCHDIVRHRAKE